MQSLQGNMKDAPRKAYEAAADAFRLSVQHYTAEAEESMQAGNFERAEGVRLMAADFRKMERELRYSS